MAKHHFLNLLHRWLWFYLSGFLIIQNFRKQPRISLYSATNHNTIATCFFYQFFCFFRRRYITISNNRNGHCLLYLSDNIPICLSGIILLSCSSMYSNSCCPCIFQNLCNFYCIYTVFCEAFTDFHSKGFFNCPRHLIHNLMHQLWIFHKSRAFSVIHHFWNGTSHVDIQNIKISMFNLLGNFCHQIRLRAKKL